MRNAGRVLCQGEGVGSGDQAALIFANRAQLRARSVMGGDPRMLWQECWSTDLMGPIQAWVSFARDWFEGHGPIQGFLGKVFSLIKERCQGKSLGPMPFPSHSANCPQRVGCLEQLQPFMTVKGPSEARKRQS